MSFETALDFSFDGPFDPYSADQAASLLVPMVDETLFKVGYSSVAISRAAVLVAVGVALRHVQDCLPPTCDKNKMADDAADLLLKINNMIADYVTSKTNWEAN